MKGGFREQETSFSHIDCVTTDCRDYFVDVLKVQIECRVCIAGAAVSSRGGRGKLSRDTNENETSERETPALLFITVSFSFSHSFFL